MSIKVLVADDSITIQKVIGIIFGGDEYSLTVVDNGKAAVDMSREIIPDILLIDALMPGMSGYEVAEAVRSTPSLASKPILILTGSFEPFDEEKAKRCGADDFIAKPFESQQIITKVKELLTLGSSRAQTAQVSTIQPAPAFLQEQVPEVSAPISGIDTPTFDQQPAAPADIWSAFTPEAEPPAESVATPSVPFNEPDVFAIVSEEHDAQLVQTAIPVYSSQQHTGSQWIPVEENTFEFEEEAIAEPPQAAFADVAVPGQETPFGDIAFEDEVTTPAATSFTTASEQVFSVPEPKLSSPAPASFDVPSPLSEIPAAPFAPLAAPATSYTAPVEPATALTEEQLKTALTSASKEVIERIVWEIVPDLAEALIREAISKIKAGA